ncbi:MAG: tetratricopeptide repeat protein [Elusimicrobiales bacterium]|jgi:tetratricopeptide (TPR) repeat protein|nr:tetratricopeptide repeat protein [Elusimicrobiales bacterium]NLH40099.1 tetratricopeptide repeat protein [Elusimicrobiota bacterium]
MKKIFLLLFSLLIITPLFSQQKLSDDFINQVKNQIEAIKSGIPNEKNPVSSYIKIAELYISIDDIDNAINYFEKAKSIEPQNANIYYRIAMCYEKKKDFSRAIENWENCIRYSNSPQITEIAKKHIKFLRELR